MNTGGKGRDMYTKQVDIDTLCIRYRSVKHSVKQNNTCKLLKQGLWSRAVSLMAEGCEISQSKSCTGYVLLVSILVREQDELTANGKVSVR